MKKLILLLAALFAAFLMVSCDDDNGKTPASDGDSVETPDADDDSAETPDEDGITDTDEITDTDINTDECTGFSVVKFTRGSYLNTYYNTELAFGGEGSDQVGISFYDSNEDDSGNSVAGTYDLASSVNNNYGTCMQCILAFEDVNEETGESARSYFQESGSLTITAGVGEEGTSKGTITSVKLIEVTINGETFESTPVEGGKCIIIESGSWTSDECETNEDCESGVCNTTGDINTCVECIESADCSANTEGKNVCSESHTCVECNENSDCSAGLCITDKNICGECATDTDCSSHTDGKTTCDNVKTYTCVNADVTCSEVTETELNSINISYNADKKMYMGLLPALGTDTDSDYVVMEFYKETPAATYNLASAGVNDNYKTCEQCVLIRENYGSENSGRIFFQTAGTLEVLEGDPKSSQYTNGIISNLTLKEVVIDSEAFTSTVVPGGACFTIVSKSWNTIPADECQTDTDCTEGKICHVNHLPENNNQCVECYEDAQCAENEVCDNILSFTCKDENPTCAPISISDPFSLNDYYGLLYFYTAPITESVLTEEAELYIIPNAETPSATYDLASEKNASFDNCEQCVYVWTDSYSFFQTAGSMKVDSGNLYTPTSSKGSLTNVAFKQYAENPATGKSAFVPGGSCLTLSSASWDVTVE